MPVLKIKTENGWEELGGTSPADGGNADTLDGKHADEFALVDDMSDLKELIGDVAVSTQITNAVSQKSQVQIITWEADD